MTAGTGTRRPGVRRLSVGGVARGGIGWLALACSIAGYLTIGEIIHQPFHLGGRKLRFFDLHIYRGAVHLALSDSPRLYSQAIYHHFGFTYPPAAALALSPLALLRFDVDRTAVLWVNVALLVWVAHSTLKLARIPAGRVIRWSLAALIAAYAIWLEPVSVTLGYGQIDLLIAGLVVFDLAQPEDWRWKGVAIGLAAGIKLTPLVFIVYLALAGRRRAALTGLVTFLGTVVVSLAVASRDTVHYWTSTVFNSSRVGEAADAADQSLRGAIARLIHTNHPGGVTEVVVVLVALAGLCLAVRALRRGQDGLGFSLCAITTLLASPISWTHHWCLAVPALILLALSAYEQRSRLLGLAAVVCGAVGFSYLPEYYMGSRDYRFWGLHSLGTDPYVLLGLVVLAVAAVAELPATRRLSRRWDPSPARVNPVPR